MPREGSMGEGTLKSRPNKGQRLAQQNIAPDQFQHQFTFVQGLKGKTERKKTRSWVTTQHYRRKHYEEGRLASETKPKAPGRRRRRSTTTSSHSDHSKDGRYEATAAGDQVKSRRSIRLPDGTQATSLLLRLGSGRVDPFNSYPIPATEEVHKLVDHYYFVIPSLVHRYWQRAARRPQSCWDLFNLYRQHEIPFLGMLHHAAHHMADLKGLAVSVQTMQFHQRTLVAVNERLRNMPGPCDDWTIIGVGLLANAERVWGDRNTARLHWGALKRLLLERGGFPALRHSPTMHTKLVWSFIALSWPTTRGNPAYVDSFAETVATAPGSPPLAPDHAFRRSCEEFVQFFNTRRRQALTNLPSTPSQQRIIERHQGRTTMFQRDSELLQALEPLATGYSNPDKRRAVENCRMACLIYLNLVMAEYGDFAPATEAYLGDLKCILVEEDDDSSLSAEHLLWTLLASSREPTHYERVWKMSRLVGVAKHAGAPTWTAIENALRTFLCLPESIAALDTVISGWSREKFLGQVMGVRQGDAEVLHHHRDAEVTCRVACEICALKPATF